MVSTTLSRLDYTVLGILFSLSAVFAGIYIALRKQLNQLSLKSFFLFFGLTVLYFLLVSLTSLWYTADVRWNYFLVLVLSLAGGVLFSRVMFVHRDPETYNTKSDIILALFLNFLGIFAYYFGYSVWSEYNIPFDPDEELYPVKSLAALFAASACLSFSIPFFVRLSYIFLQKIPGPIFPQWIYPAGKDLPPFDYGDGDPQTKINLQFSTKEEGGEKFVRLTLIPNEMILGDFIYVYFEAWNENQERNMSVELTDRFGRSHAFRFYAVANPNSTKKRRLDPTKTALFNKLKSEEIIIIERESRYQ